MGDTVKHYLLHEDIRDLCNQLGLAMVGAGPKARTQCMYPIPRGGVPVAYMLAGLYPNMLAITSDLSKATCYVDDIIDSGATRAKWCASPGVPHLPFFAMIDKTKPGSFSDSWVVFPWEGDEEQDEGIEDNIRRILQYVGEDPKRGGLIETPGRVAKAWTHWCSGYGADISKLLKTFEDGADGCDEMVVLKDLPFYTHCEHHMAPFFGTATIAYIPDGKIVGLSKIPRLLDAFARRLQVQERLTNQMADALQEHLSPLGVGVVIKARHLCMESRGIQQQGHHTVTSALRGVMRDVPETRAEFLSLAR